MRVLTLMVRNDSRTYPYAPAQLLALFRRRMPSVHHTLVIADNGIDPGYEGWLPGRIRLFGAPNDYFEFSAWTHGFYKLKDELEQYDLLNIATSAFRNPPNDWLEDFNDNALEYAEATGCALGHIDYMIGNYFMDNYDLTTWLRTCFIVMRPSVALALGSFVSLDSPGEIFSENPDNPFLRDCGLSEEVQRHILDWLCGEEGKGQDVWHKHFKLTRQTLGFFKSKALAILNEHMLSARLVELGIPLVDVNLLAEALAEANNPAAIPVERVQKTAIANGDATQHSCLSAVCLTDDDQWKIVGEYQTRPEPEKNTVRPRMLFIDHRMLTPDQDSGSLTSLGMLKTYIELGFDIFFLPNDYVWQSGYTEALENLGVHCPRFETNEDVKEWLFKIGAFFDIVVLTRVSIASMWFETVKIYCTNACIIFNTMDLQYLRVMREAILKGHAPRSGLCSDVKDFELELCHKSDAVLLVSKYELDLLAEEGLGSKSCFIPMLYQNVETDVPPWSARKDLVFIGGFDHTPNTDAVFFFSHEIFPLIRRELPNIKFHIIGSNPTWAVRDLGKIPGIVVHGFVPDLAPIMRNMRVGVVPLRYGAGIKGKISTFMKYGIPVASTPIGCESMPHGSGTGVFPASDPEDFARLTVSLYINEDLWTQASANTLKTCEQEYSFNKGKLRQIEFADKFMPDVPLFMTWSVGSQDEYVSLQRLIGPRLNQDIQARDRIAEREISNFAITGYCAICGRKSDFRVHADPGSGRPSINWRETEICRGCGLQSRARAALHYFFTRMRPAKNAFIYATEQITPLYHQLKRRFSGLIGSEYVSPEAEPGRIYTLETNQLAVRHEDITRLSFPSNSIDYILSFDVLEHVADDMAAFRETCRVLRPGGSMLFTVPFMTTNDKNVVRAELEPDGRIKHLLPPEYHGNPLSSKGSLAFRTFAWEMLDEIKAAGFENSWAEFYWSNAYGYHGPGLLFIAKKGARNYE